MQREQADEKGWLHAVGPSAVCASPVPNGFDAHCFGQAVETTQARTVTRGQVRVFRKEMVHHATDREKLT
jgi:hypothetical protein